MIRDEVVLTVTALLVMMLFFATCTAVTGFSFSRKHWLYKVSAAERRDVWQLPVIVAVSWTPIILWRAWQLRRP